MALVSGWQAKPLAVSRVRVDAISRREAKDFLAACHRGFEKAQNRIVEMLCSINSDSMLCEDERGLRILLLRKAADAIAHNLLQHRIHYVRRLLLHEDAPTINVPVLLAAHKEANRLNSESRLTFALLADLTTFVHVADIVRIDFRSAKARVSLIELKSGRVNKLLLEHLEHYESKPESLAVLRSDPAIEPRHLKQAERMLRQKIRHLQLKEIIETDEGVDFVSGAKVVWSKEETKLESFDAFLERLCTAAMRTGGGAGSVSHCLHLGVGFADNTNEARFRAIECVNFAIRAHMRDLPKELATVVDEVRAVVPEGERFMVTNCFESNLASLAVRPFLNWRLETSHIQSLVKRELVIMLAFDVAGFLWLCRRIGFQIGFGTKRKAAEHQQLFGKENIVTWGGRELSYETPRGNYSVGGGILSRFANDLSNPLAFMKATFEQDVGTLH